MDMTFQEAVQGLLAGDFSRLAPLFEPASTGSPCPIIKWVEAGRFAGEPQAMAEAFTCACFNGCAEVIEYLLARGVDADGGAATGLNALHWAANRGQLQAVEILLRNQASLETRNAYGGTVLGCAVWSAVHEFKPDHLPIIKALLEAGAEIGEAAYPSGDERVDAILREYRAATA